jgi:hypothetical protein
MNTTNTIAKPVKMKGMTELTSGLEFGNDVWICPESIWPLGGKPLLLVSGGGASAIKSQSISKKARIVSARSRGRTKGDCKGPLHYHRLLNEESEVSTIPGMLRDTMNQRQYVLIYLNVKME